MNKILRSPNDGGWWWMNDTRRYGWEIVDVNTTRSDGLVCWRTGFKYPSPIDPEITEWILIDEPAKI